MNPFSRAYTPTSNRRLNELVGFLLFVTAILLLLALVSYSPGDRSLNTAGPAPASRPAHNWVGILGAYGSDLLLQAAGIAAFLLPVMLAFLGGRWFRSRTVGSPGAKFAGALMLLVFAPGMLGLLPGHLHWRDAIPIEGLLGRIVGDALIHWFNLAGAYIVCAAVLAIGLYLSTTFSFGKLGTWSQTRFTFVFAGLDRVKDWRIVRAKARSLKELEKRRAPRAGGQRAGSPSLSRRCRRSLCLRPSAAEEPVLTAVAEENELPGHPRLNLVAGEPALRHACRRHHESQDHDAEALLATTSCRPARCCTGPDEQQGIDEDELKRLAQVLTEKCAEFDVHGQVTQINPGPVVTTFEFKPEAGIKYSRITSLTDDLCLALRAESILIERMAGKSTVGIQVPNRERETIWLREIIESQEFHRLEVQAHAAWARTSTGASSTADLAAMPHLLIAGSTGSGKSVAINAMIMSILYKATPEQVAPDPGRSQAAGAGRLRRRASPLHADHHRAQAGGQRPAQRRARNGAAAEAAGGKGRPQHRPVQPLFDDDDTRACSSEQSDEPRRCPTSSSSSTSWPT